MPETLTNIQKDERILINDKPMLLVKYKFLTIKTKSGALIPLALNSVQKIIVAIIESLNKKGTPVRLLLLKARQMGVSTLIEAIIYALTTNHDGINSLVLADDIKGSNYIFEMQKLFHDKLEAQLKPKVKHSNEKKLEFVKIHSQVLIDTAENPNAGRKFTLQYVHLSEAAFFRSLEVIMLGLLQSVPKLPNTMIVLESTANGVGNAFYDRWCEAVEGSTDWKPIFIPWFELPEYSMPLDKKELYPIESIKANRKRFLEEENILQKKFSLSNEQLNWRRWCIVNNCRGDVNFFKQEYPATWQEAFIMSGDLYFDRDALLLQEEYAQSRSSTEFPNGHKVGNFVILEGKIIFRECEEGGWRVYEFAKRDDQYCIGADCAEGLAHGDDQAAVVLNKKTNKTAAAFNCQCDTDGFAEELIKAGRFYNQAMIGPENKGYGTTVCKRVFNNYGNVYRKIRDKTGSIIVTDELGWNTNRTTRDQMLMQFKDEVKESSTEILDKEILAQMRTFINNPKKKRPEAEAGKKDDLVFARAIAGMLRIHYPNVSRRASEEARANSIYSRQLPVNQGYGYKKD